MNQYHMIGEDEKTKALIEALQRRVNICGDNVYALGELGGGEVDGEGEDYWNGALSSAAWALDIVKTHLGRPEDSAGMGCIYNHDHVAEPGKCEWCN